MEFAARTPPAVHPEPSSAVILKLPYTSNATPNRDPERPGVVPEGAYSMA